MENQIQKIIQTSGLKPDQAKPLLDNFGNYFVEAHKLVTKGKGIKVTDVSQLAEMQQAREIRLQLAKLRVEADKTRVTLKEGYLRGGNAVQAIFNDIRDIVKPEEDRLLEQEKFKERVEAELLAKKHAERIEKLSMYVEDVSLYSLKDMSDEAFTSLLEKEKSAFKKRLADEKEAEEKRIAEEKAYQKEQEQIRLENIKLRKEAEEKERLVEIERKKQADLLRIEQEKREKFEAKVRAEKEAEAKKQADAQAKIEADKKAQEETDRKKELAPDKVKLQELVNTIISLPMPAVKDRQARLLVTEIENELQKIVDYVNIEIKNL